LLRSEARFADAVLLLSAHRQDQLPLARTHRIGPALIFERLWQQTGWRAVIEALLEGRAFESPVERAIVMTVLHRLMIAGSDRAAEKWRRDYAIDGTEELRLHHLYRAMARLGETLPESAQSSVTPFSPRCTKDLIEKRIFAWRRGLFSSLDLVFFDTTSIYFEGERAWASTATARITARTASRWWSALYWITRPVRSAASCGRATLPM
jgi:hypothetical protein